VSAASKVCTSRPSAPRSSCRVTAAKMATVRSAQGDGQGRSRVEPGCRRPHDRHGRCGSAVPIQAPIRSAEEGAAERGLDPREAAQQHGVGVLDGLEWW
jgi:hypothetical protein